MHKDKKVAISYRVLQSWRKPVFDRIDMVDGINLRLYTSDDFLGTKVINYSGMKPSRYWIKLRSINFLVRRDRGNLCLPFAPSLYIELKKFRPDIVISEGASNLLNNVVCYFYCRFHGAKLIQWGLGELPGKRRGLAGSLYARIIRFYESKSDGAICYSSHAKNYYVSCGIKESKCVIALNVIDTQQRLRQINEIQEKLGFDYYDVAPAKKIAYLGALEANKDVDKFIELAADLQEVYPELEVVVIGDGPLRSMLEDLSTKLAVNNIRFFGHLKGELASVLLGASILILPSLGGLAISEGIIHGVPVLCGPADGTESDLLAHQPDFLMQRKLRDDYPTWRQAAINLLSDSELVLNIRSRGLVFIGDNGIDSYVNSIVSILD